MSDAENKFWNTEELQEDFNVIAFIAPYVNVQRKSDGAMGYMEFDHMPRRYYNFVEESA